MIGPVALLLSATGVAERVEAVTSSLRSVLDVLEASGGLREAVANDFPDLFSREGADGGICLIADAGDLLVIEVIDRPADGAHQISLSIKPSQRYVELMAAISGDRDVPFDFDFHENSSCGGFDDSTVGEGGAVPLAAAPLTSRGGC